MALDYLCLVEFHGSAADSQGQHTDTDEYAKLKTIRYKK